MVPFTCLALSERIATLLIRRPWVAVCLLRSDGRKKKKARPAGVRAQPKKQTVRTIFEALHHAIYCLLVIEEGHCHPSDVFLDTVWVAMLDAWGEMVQCHLWEGTRDSRVTFVVLSIRYPNEPLKPF